jgi:flavin reductase (DIM6/NTAB) family NADH-FMN oxidoreductase RutF
MIGWVSPSQGAIAMNAASPDAFRQAMRRVAATVTIVTTVAEGGEPAGVTATAVSSVSLEPPSLLVCINRNASIHDALTRRGAFCVNILTHDQADIARSFSATGERSSRFARGHWREGPAGLPYLPGSRANLFCETAKLVEFGTHTIAIGVVRDVMAEEGGMPLIYLDGNFLSESTT